MFVSPVFNVHRVFFEAGVKVFLVSCFVVFIWDFRPVTLVLVQMKGHAPHFAWLLSLAGAATSIIFVATKQNTSFVATKVLSQQNLFGPTEVCLCFCCDNHIFVTTKGMFSRDKPGKTHVCRDKTFIETKIILVAAPANDRLHGVVPGALVAGWRSLDRTSMSCGGWLKIAANSACDCKKIKFDWMILRTRLVDGWYSNLVTGLFSVAILSLGCRVCWRGMVLTFWTAILTMSSGSVSGWRILLPLLSFKGPLMYMCLTAVCFNVWSKH